MYSSVLRILWALSLSSPEINLCAVGGGPPVFSVARAWEVPLYLGSDRCKEIEI